MGLSEDFAKEQDMRYRYERLLAFAVKNAETVDPAQSAQLINQVQRLLDKLDTMPSEKKDILDDIAAQTAKRRAEAQKSA